MPSLSAPTWSRAVRATFVPILLLLAAPVAAQERTLAMGRTVQDVLRDGDPVGRSRRSPYQVWTFEGRRGQRVTFEAHSSDFDTYLSVRDAEGYLIGRDDDSGEGTDARVRAILPRDGVYRLILSAFSESGRGLYTLSATGWEVPEAAPAGQPGTLRTGETHDGLLEPGDDIAGDGPFQDRWTFEARAGQRLLVQMRSEDFDAYLIVLDADGRELATDDDGLSGRDAQVSIRAAAAGRLTAIATSFGEDPQSGAYRLALIEETGNFAEPGMPSLLAPGEANDGRLELGDRSGARGYLDEWTFTGRAGQMARVDVTSQTFDPYVVLRQGGTPLDSNDDGGEGTNARLATVLPRDGEYTLVVSAYTEGRQGGRYRVALGFADAPLNAGRTGRITAGRGVSGRLEPGDQRRGDGAYQDEWEFDGRANQEVIVEMRADDFDAFLELRDDRGTLVSENDDGGDGTNSLLTARLPRNGRYRIIARSFGDSERSGFYELTLTVASGTAAAPGRAQELRLDEVMVGRLESGDSVVGDGSWADVFTFRAPNDGELVLEMRSGAFDTYLIVRESDGATLGTDDDGGDGTNSRLQVRVVRGRSYRVYANSYGADMAEGSYQLTARWVR